MARANLLKNRLQEVPKDVEEFVSLSFDISDRVRDVLDEKNISQRELAKLLGKRESEISKWLKGTHNFTLETIAKISIVLDVKLLYVPTKTKNISDIREAIGVFENLYKLKSYNNTPTRLIITTPEEKHVYMKVENLNQTNSIGNVFIKGDNSSSYKVACAADHVELAECQSSNIFFNFIYSNMKNKQSGFKEVNISLNKIQDCKFNYNLEFKYSREILNEGNLPYNIVFKYNISYNLKEELFFVTLYVAYEDKDSRNLILEAENRFDFRIKDLSSLITVQNENSFSLEVDFMPTLINIAIGTMRGIIYSRTGNSLLSEFPLPIISMNELMNNAHSQSLK